MLLSMSDNVQNTVECSESVQAVTSTKSAETCKTGLKMCPQYKKGEENTAFSKREPHKSEWYRFCVKKNRTAQLNLCSKLKCKI